MTRYTPYGFIEPLDVNKQSYDVQSPELARHAEKDSLWRHRQMTNPNLHLL